MVKLALQLLTFLPLGMIPSFTSLISVAEKPSSVSLVRNQAFNYLHVLSKSLFNYIGGMKVKADREESSPYAGKSFENTFGAELHIAYSYVGCY